jgi:antitoxin HigA-1
MASERRSRRNSDRPPTHPGAFLREIVLPEIGLSKLAVADRLGVSRQHLYDILDERRAVTPATALRFGKLFGNGPRLWLNMQRTWDLWHAERELADELEAMAPIDADEDDGEESPRRASGFRAVRVAAAGKRPQTKTKVVSATKRSSTKSSKVVSATKTKSSRGAKWQGRG